MSFFLNTAICGFSLYHILAFFLIYSCLGWCLEVVYAAATTGQLVNRGFLNGPVCPIYGFGMIIVLFALTPLQHSILLLYIGGVILPSALELVGGWALYKLYRTRWWDYSDKKFNIGGYICPQFTVVWGLACLLIMKVVQPAIAFAVELIWKPVGIAALCLFYAAIITDVILTFPEVKKLRNEIRLIDDLEKQLTAVSDAIGSDLSDKTAQAVEFTKEHRITAEEMQKRADMFKAKLETASDSVKQRNSERLSELKGNASERREELTARFNELNEKLSELKAKHKRLYKAFPSLKNGRKKLKKVISKKK